MRLVRLWKRSSVLKAAIIAALLCGIVGVACTPSTEGDHTKARDDSTALVPTTPPAGEPSGEIDRTDLDACITDAVLRENVGKYGNGEFATEAHTILKVVESGGSFTVYPMVPYAEFDFTSDGVVETGGSHGPRAIIFRRDEDGKLELLPSSPIGAG